MWRKLLAHPPADRPLLAEACLRLVEARIRLLVLGFSRATRGSPQLQAVGRSVIDDKSKVRWAIENTGARLPGSFSCLLRALAATRMLSARGHSPSLIYAVFPLQAGNKVR
jgi:hypothetical protein